MRTVVKSIQKWCKAYTEDIKYTHILGVSYAERPPVFKAYRTQVSLNLITSLLFDCKYLIYFLVYLAIYIKPQILQSEVLFTYSGLLV